jgi:hypothetical protein
MSDVAYITNAAATLTFTAGSKTVTVTGTNPILEGVLRGDRAPDPNGMELAIDAVAAGTLTLLRNAPTSGTVQFDIAPVSRLRTSLAANAEVTRDVYAKLLAAVEDNRSIPVISLATAPPGSPADGDRHLVIATATGVFAGKEGYIAQYDTANTRWIFIAPIAGMKVTIDGSAVLRIYTGAAWTVSGATAASEIAFTPTGGVAATTVQAAIAEVDSEKVTKASGTTVGRLWRFTDTAGGLGQSQTSEDGSGNIAWGASGGLGSLTSAGFRHGDANTPAARFDASAANVTQTASVSFSARGRPNAFEWGHGNSAGYACTFGYQSSSGRPYIVFNGEAGSTVINTIRTRGVKARGLIGDNAGGLSFFTVANASADDQTIVEDAKLSSLGYLGLAGNNNPAAPLTIASSSSRVTPGGGYLVQSYGGGNSYWLLNAAANFNSAVHFGDPDSNTVGKIEYIHNGDRMEFHTAGAERMRLTSTGKLLLGGTSNGGEMLTITAPAGGYGYIITDSTYATNCIRFSAGYGVEMGNIGGSPMHFITNNAQRISILADGKVGINATTPAAQFDVNGDVAHRMSSLTVANGANQNVSRPAFSSLRISAPTAAFNIGGLTGGTDGLECELINTTAHQMTLNNEDASSTAGNRIVTDTGGNLNCKHAVLRYDATASRWRVISFRT